MKVNSVRVVAGLVALFMVLILVFYMPVEKKVFQLEDPVMNVTFTRYFSGEIVVTHDGSVVQVQTWMIPSMKTSRQGNIKTWRGIDGFRLTPKLGCHEKPGDTHYLGGLILSPRSDYIDVWSDTPMDVKCRVDQYNWARSNIRITQG